MQVCNKILILYAVLHINFIMTICDFDKCIELSTFLRYIHYWHALCLIIRYIKLYIRRIN